MKRKEQGGIKARAFVLVASAAAAATVRFSVVKAAGYPPYTGLIYFFGYFIAMVLFFQTLGFALSGGAE